MRFFTTLGCVIARFYCNRERLKVSSLTFEGLFAGMRAHVFGQGTVNGGGIRAKAALEGLLAGVFAQMASERALLATGVRTKLTLEGLFPRVDADVLRQVPLRRRRVRAQRALILLL